MSLEEEINTNLNDETETLFKEFDEICNEISNMKNTMGTLTTKLRQYKKKIDKILKEKAKEKVKSTNDVDGDGKKEKKPKKEKEVKEKKEKKKKVIEPPSGINKPTTISEQLCEFLNKPKGTEMVRHDVTELIYEYIKQNKLQNATSKLIINPDDTLCNLLGIDKNEKLTYQNLQTFMKDRKRVV
jgi:chromatin remodeling complex protein RSC6